MEKFEVIPGESVAENIRRILNGQIDRIAEHCPDSGEEDIHSSVHEIRKCCKRIRAVLRLVRDEIGYSAYYRENVFYRDLSRRLSAMRSFNVLVNSTQILQSDLSDTIPVSSFEPLIGTLTSRRNKMFERLVIQENMMQYIRRQAEGSRARIGDLSLIRDDFGAFQEGLRRVYRQGRKFRDISRQSPTPHNLHQLRKKMKYLWYQMLILQPIFPPMLEVYTDTLDRIGENLGNIHDFSELQLFLKENHGILENRMQTTLTDACEAKKASILGKTWNDIDTIYGEKPKELARRFAWYWRVYRNGQRASFSRMI